MLSVPTAKEMNSRLASISGSALLIGMTNLYAATEFESYKPYDHPYPQIIQAFDYPTIDAIRTLAKSLGNFEINQAVLGSENTLSIGGVSEVHISTDFVQINSRRFSDTNTFVTFSTLFRILNDQFSLGEEFQLYSANWQSSAYSSLSEIMINVNCSHIISLTENSSGPNEPERLYVLNIDSLNAGYFFSRCNAQ